MSQSELLMLKDDVKDTNEQEKYNEGANMIEWYIIPSLLLISGPINNVIKRLR